MKLNQSREQKKIIIICHLTTNQFCGRCLKHFQAAQRRLRTREDYLQSKSVWQGWSITYHRRSGFGNEPSRELMIAGAAVDLFFIRGEKKNESKTRMNVWKCVLLWFETSVMKTSPIWAGSNRRPSGAPKVDNAFNLSAAGSGSAFL